MTPISDLKTIYQSINDEVIFAERSALDMDDIIFTCEDKEGGSYTVEMNERDLYGVLDLLTEIREYKKALKHVVDPYLDIATKFGFSERS